ncbi:IclR family transcriptional regulator [Actinomadura spongiicola]|uniref:IclR family transcriptional regulator n=1 Tax=Actinomadura spongiicola TaxID=2303421 RepID=A0A372G992_9ACTN|nr:IclR family transcriptional regulator [Actinomadura spongiicola]RFS81956.1 IclR family transcriptional regulator [Actinomadura spongiicola]
MAREVPAVSRALNILELFLDVPTLSAPDIAARLRLPRTTVHELLTTLVGRHYLVAVPGQPTRYRLGVRLFQLGGVFAQNLDLIREAQEVADETAAACGETVQVGVLEGDQVLYIARAESTHPVRMVSTVGRLLPAHCTGLGKVLLAGLPPEELDELFPDDRELVTMTANSIASPDRLREEIARTRETGLGHDDAESNDAVHCVAAGVHDHTGALVASMSISVPSPRWDDDVRDRLGDLVRERAGVLSARLGHLV